MADELWDWVYKYSDSLYDRGEEDMAYKIDNFSTIAYSKSQEEVEAAFPELLAFARSENNAWLEVYLRHWRLQAYVNSLSDPRPLVAEALDLLAFAHTDAAVDCPQRTCVTDDLNAIYASIDAPGFAPERLDMLNELLETTPVNKGCYTCLAVGKVDCLLDMGKPAEALESWKDSLARSASLTADASGDHYYRYLAESIAHAHIGCGDFKQALDILDKCTPPKAEHLALINLHKAEAWLGLGDFDQAGQAWDIVLAQTDADLDGSRVAAVLRNMIEAGALMPTSELAGRLRDIADCAHRTGRVREAFDAAGLACDMSLHTSSPDIAKAMLGLMQDLLPQLNRPLGGDRQIAQFSAALDAS